ncbi:hypothetical protein TorRG33x02_142020 [Trema orientale]|uniref:Uncharacterized protein n=1 Tax=Trema orientale TaxID=63057 RepID=A0A2P5EWJ4_TREOI|nr:hypothetical protein TorRG33x02_142020 [Trema orientale]
MLLPSSCFNFQTCVSSGLGDQRSISSEDDANGLFIRRRLQNHQCASSVSTIYVNDVQSPYPTIWYTSVRLQHLVVLPQLRNPKV